ncbi:putative vacuolar amino acid transporter YPQ3 [Choanephora cucurbitarum]|uniref:Putative vacuolar amino acid transporter YPQ3 n=1 Tax=Choanephora cucurbitarum TaxID=101091 RepID=A0A1C7NE68_9FUNG|nr:putative vacuolar amino acid transporter YPQ3 [Choanephora cucurbitarum]
METVCPVLENGSTAIGWIYNIFGDCVYGFQESFSLLFGYLSIFCWLNAQMPQVIKNYRRRDAEGLSFTFLTVWLTGDVANFIGCIITGQLPFQLYLSIYYTIIDTVLCFQWLYYVKYTDNRIRRWFDGDDEVKPAAVISQDNNGNSHLIGERIYTTYSTGGGKEINEQSSLLGSSPQPKKYITMMLFFGFLTFNGLADNSNLLTTESIMLTADHHDENKAIWVGRFFAWLCTFLYLSSRLPQIYQNFSRRSVEGLSMALFFFAAMGNLTYVLSIFTNPHATRAKMLEAVPYIIGSAGTLMFDATIFCQYALFKNRPLTEESTA